MLKSERFVLKFHQKGDIVGQSGVELPYNDLLMGKKDGSRKRGWLKRQKGKRSGRPPNANIPAGPGQKRDSH